MKDEVTERIDAILNSEIELTEAIVVNGDKFLPKGTILQVVHESAPLKPVDELMDYANVIKMDLRKSKLPVNRDVVYEILFDEFEDDYSDEEYDQVLTAIFPKKKEEF